MALAYFSTWTTYGAWLPGDIRGWYQRGCGLRKPDALIRFEAALRMVESPVKLNHVQRELVHQAIVSHCGLRAWTLHAVNCRSNHVHVVVTAPGRPVDLPREQFKAWCTRRLREQARLASV